MADKTRELDRSNASEKLRALRQSHEESRNRQMSDAGPRQERQENAKHERDALLALCLGYDQLIQSIVISRRWRLGNAIGDLLTATTPVFLRALAMKFVRLVRRAGKTSTPSKSRFDLEYEDLHQRLTSLLYDDLAPPSPATPPPPPPVKIQPAPPAEAEVTPPNVDRSASVVSVLYNGADVIERFLKAIENQTFDGTVQVLLVDDCSTDGGADIARAYAANLPANSNLDIRVIQNAENVGNCESRNTGVADATGDFIVVIDSDCIINSRFLSEHSSLHEAGYDVVIGPMGLESRVENVDSLIARLDGDRTALAGSMKIQFPQDLTNCVNCVTRNFSVARGMVERIDRPLFDTKFSYRNSPDTGFGWEDVEMGTTLFEAGASIAFTWNAFSVHLSHPPMVPDHVKARGSKRNFELLLAAHPRLTEIASEWTRGTASKIHAWVQRYDPSNIDLSRFMSQLAANAKDGEDTVVYSAIAGDYDSVRQPPSRGSARSVLFTDARDPDVLWETASFDAFDSDPARTAKKPKVLPHVYFPNAEWSVWIDGNVELLVDPQELIEEVESTGNLLGLFRHPERDCIYDEATRCIARAKDSPGTIRSQIERYRRLGYPRHQGLAECNVIVRRHNDKRVVKAMCDWWREIEAASRRDQLSFNFVLWKNSLNYHELGGGVNCVRTDKRFSYNEHLR